MLYNIYTDVKLMDALKKKVVHVILCAQRHLTSYSVAEGPILQTYGTSIAQTYSLTLYVQSLGRTQDLP